MLDRSLELYRTDGTRRTRDQVDQLEKGPRAGETTRKGPLCQVQVPTHTDPYTYHLL